MSLCIRKNKVESIGTPYNELSKEEKVAKTMQDREEFLEKLRLYKFYKASNFYEDNIGHVEVATADDEIITTSF